MPWTPAQIRLFGAQAARGEISEREFKKRREEGTRKDVDRSGHALRKSKRVPKRKSHRRVARR